MVGESRPKKRKRPGARPPELHIDLELEILSWLPAPTVLRLRSVCKDWNSWTRHCSFTEQHLSRSMQIRRDPRRQPHVLMLLPGRDVPGDDTGLVVQAGNMRFSDALARVPKYIYVVSTCNGLVCVQIDDRQIAILKPLTDELLLLPILTERNDVVCWAFGFGFEGEDKEYNVVAWWVRKSAMLINYVVYCTIPLHGNPSRWIHMGRFTFPIPFLRPQVVVGVRRIVWLAREALETDTGKKHFPALMTFDMRHKKFENLSLAKVEPRPWFQVEEANVVLVPTDLDGHIGLLVMFGTTVQIWRRIIQGRIGDSWVRIFRLQHAVLWNSIVKVSFADYMCRDVYCFCNGRTIFIGCKNRYITYDRKTRRLVVTYEERSHSDVICVPFVMSLVPLPVAVDSGEGNASL